MKMSIATVTRLSILGLASYSEAKVPENHPSVDVLSKFSPHFRCPYAAEWIAKGPKQAALDLGLWKNSAETSDEHIHLLRRRTQDSAVAGSCVYTNSWSGQPDCLEMRGDLWTTSSMEARCASEADGTFSTGMACTFPQNMAGWCVVGSEGSIEATPLALSGSTDCAQLQNVCETFMQGTFNAEGQCASGSSANNDTAHGSTSFPYAVPATGDDSINCVIAPGAVGAGHQAAYSLGYSPVCPGTPAEGSPYMWPMAWTANVESKSMAFGSDDVVYTSVGKVHYRLDKNWKRQDWWYQRGVQRSVGQSPCPPENVVKEADGGSILACERNSDEYKTMIHRGGKMMFISWKNDTQVGSSDPAQIADCNWVDLQIIGNIRPDWFMDDRGDSTDVQYLGNQHVYYENEPRLVKQWRKKDFASQYFVMSMLENPKEDGFHWPMILNVPGEGFGDDFLQIYTNQSVLSDDDDYLFLLDEALGAINGTCKQMEIAGGGGPPTGQTEPIPSNLEVDPNSWFSNVYTFSPVWVPAISNDTQQSQAGASGMATTEAGNVIVHSCYDPTTSAVQLSVEFIDIEKTDDDQYPWMALGYRETDECLMNPRGGGESEIILLTLSSNEDSVEPHFGLLPSTTKSFDSAAVTSIYDSLIPLAEKDGYSDVHIQAPTTDAATLTKSAGDSSSSSLILKFRQSMEATPEVMHLMYAIGSSTQVGYHRTRECFEITEFPNCPVVSEEPVASTSNLSGVEKSNSEGSMKEPTSSARHSVDLVTKIVVGAMAFILLL